MDNLNTTLKINEIFYSIQGESTYAGLPCVFIRLTGCNLRCTYCDTEYAFYDGDIISIEEILSKIREFPCNLVEITGGEPLMQPNCIPLMKTLLDANYAVLLETSGSIDLANVPEGVVKIVDFKCPSSGMEKKNLWSIITNINPEDEIKFVIGHREDFDWAMEKIHLHGLDSRCEVLMSPVHESVEYETLSKWILDSGLSIRFQIQLHKHIWSPESRGV